MPSSPARRLLITAGIALPALVLPALPALASPAPGPVLEVVTDGLDNPRGLTIGKDGTAYVTGSGRGGDQCRDLQSSTTGDTRYSVFLEDAMYRVSRRVARA